MEKARRTAAEAACSARLEPAAESGTRPSHLSFLDVEALRGKIPFLQGVQGKIPFFARRSGGKYPFCKALRGKFPFLQEVQGKIPFFVSSSVVNSLFCKKFRGKFPFL
jgi:hypothetical protein